MAVDPIGGSPELEPVIDAPVPGGSSPLPVEPQPQAPTGFGGPTPGIQPSLPSSPVTINRSSPMPGSMAAAVQPHQNRPFSAWTGEQVADDGPLDYMILSVFPDISGANMNNVKNVIIATGDPSILELSAEKARRQIGLTTAEMFEEDALVHMLGTPGDSEAFVQGAVDTYLETGGAALTAATMFAESDETRQYWRKGFLENEDTRRRITEAAYAADPNAAFLYEQAKGLALASGLPEPLEPTEALISEINGLRGKAGSFLVDGNRLVVQFKNEDPGADDKEWLGLIVLDPGTEIVTQEDAILAYLVAEAGYAHTLASSSDDVPGRQTILGAMIEGFDNHLANIEQWGTGNATEAVKDSQVAVSSLMFPRSRSGRSLEARQAEEDSIREQETRTAVERNFATDSIVAIIQQAAVENPDVPMSNLVTAGISAFNTAPDELKEAVVVQQIEDLEAAAAAKIEQQSMLGRIIEEDIAPPVLDVLAAWDAGIHFIGIVALDVANNGILEFAREVDEKGVAAFTDPDSLARLAPVDSQFLMEQFQNVKDEGLPKAMGSYFEGVREIGTIANYYGIPEDSAWASWVNMGGSILFDPITWATLGGAASWNALKKGIFTAGGVERIVQSRPLLSAARNVVVNDSVRSLPVLSAGGMSSNAIRRLANIAKTVYKTHGEKVAAMEEVLAIFRMELPGGGAGGLWIPSGPAKVLRRKTTQGLANLAGIAVKDPQARSFLQDILIRATRNRTVSIGERGWMNDLFNLAEIRRLNNVDGFADDIVKITELFEAYRSGDDAIALLQGKVQTIRQEMVDISGGLTDEVRQVPSLRKAVVDWNDSIKALDESIAKMGADDPLRPVAEEARQGLTDAAEEAVERATGRPVSAIGLDEWQTLPDDTLITVYHSTTEEGAETLTTKGIVAGSKPGKRAVGEAAGPGATHSPGTYVSGEAAGVSGFGDGVIVEIVVRKGDISIPAEYTIGRTRPFAERQFGAINTPTAGAVLEGDIPAANIRRFQDAAVLGQSDKTLEGLQAARQQAIAARDEIEALLRSYDGGVSIGPDGYTNLPGNPYDSYVKEIRRRQRLLGQYEAQITDLGTAGRDRAVLERATQTYMDEWADEWGVPLLRDLDGNTIDHPIYPDLKRRNWDGILGEGETASYYGSLENVGVLEPFGTSEAALRQLGMGPQAGSTLLPISPQELLAWHTMNQSKTGRAAWKYFQAHPKWKEVGDGMQAFWSMSVLFSPRTAFRSHLDEVVRFYEDAGMGMDLWKSTTPKWFPKGGVGSEARAFTRDSMGSFVGPGSATWGMVSPARKGQWVHAERWLNGSIVKDPLFRAYARAYTGGADDAARRALWETWYNDTGVHLAKKTTIAGEPVTASKAYDIMDKSFNNWMTGIREAPKRGRISRAQAHADIMRAAAEGKPLEWGPATWRQLPEVPAEFTPSGGFHPFEGGFNALYGKPQQRRGSVFFDHYYEWAYNNYRGAYDGKVIDADWLLANGKAVDKYHAQELMNQGHRSNVVRELINESGMVLDDDLRNAAMNWAAASADDMMYTFGATSILGKKMARVYPFGRAQVDYMQWWWKKLSQPTQLHLPGAGRYQAGVVGGASRMAAVPAVGANVRLIDRMAHLLNLGNTGTPGERPGALTPAGMVNNFTFLPTDVDEQLLIETTPNFGPVPSWLLNAPLDDTVPGWTEMRDVVQELHPAHRIFTNPADNAVEWMASLADALFPKGGLGVRNELAAANNFAALVYAYATLRYDPTKPLTDDQQRRIHQYANAWVLNSSQGPWRADYIQLDQAKWLDENSMTRTPDLNTDGEVMREWAFLNDQAAVAALTEDAKDFFGKIAGAAEFSGSDFQYVESMIPVGADGWPNLWLESGSIPQSKFDGIMSGYELMTSGEASPEDRLAYADEVLDTIFHFLTDAERAEFLAKNPGMHVNMVSSYEVVPSLVPLDAVADVDGTRIDPNASPERKRELRAQGKAEHWLDYRDNSAVRHDSFLSSHRTFRTYLDVIYEDATGVPYGARTVDVDGERVSISEMGVTLTPEWWKQHGAWLEETGAFKISSTDKAALVAGRNVEMVQSDLKELVRAAKSVYTYQLDIDSSTEAKLNRIGLDSRPASNLAYNLTKVDGFDMIDFDRSVDMSHYGADLMKDFDDALEAGQEYEGWESFEDWERDTVMFEVKETDDFGEEIIVVKTYSKEDLMRRFRVAVALSDEPNDTLEYTEDDYNNSIHGRELGELNWEPPAPPPLSETVAYHETTYDNLRIVDGDTIEIAGETGPVFVRLLGLNTPEKGQPGYEAAWRGLDNLLRDADKVQFAVFDPDRYGVKVSSLAREGGSIVHRDRLLVWLYVNGIPVFDPGEFSPTNIRGVETGGSVPQYQVLYENAGGS